MHDTRAFYSLDCWQRSMPTSIQSGILPTSPGWCKTVRLVRLACSFCGLPVCSPALLARAVSLISPQFSHPTSSHSLFSIMFCKSKGRRWSCRRRPALDQRSARGYRRVVGPWIQRARHDGFGFGRHRRPHSNNGPRHNFIGPTTAESTKNVLRIKGKGGKIFDGVVAQSIVNQSTACTRTYLALRRGRQLLRQSCFTACEIRSKVKQKQQQPAKKLDGANGGLSLYPCRQQQ